jgi:hypothetical protein
MNISSKFCRGGGDIIAAILSESAVCQSESHRYNSPRLQTINNTVYLLHSWMDTKVDFFLFREKRDYNDIKIYLAKFRK